MNAIKFPKPGKSSAIAIAIAVLAIILRILWIGRTDSTGDEIFGVKLAYKLSLFLAHHWLVPITLIAVLAALVYFVGFKKNWKLAGLVGAALVAVQLFTSIPLTLHISNGPMIYIFNAFMIFLTGLPPHIAGELTVTLFMALMAVAGYFLAKTYINRKFAWIVFAALLASPLGMFLGGTSFAYGLSDSLMYIALAMFLVGLKKKPELISLAGIAFATSIATRYPPLLMLLFFAVIIWHKRKLLLGRDYRPALLAFVLLVGGTTIAYAIEASNTYYLWNNLWFSMPGSADKPHFSVYLGEIELNAANGQGNISDHIYALFVNFFYTPAIWLFLAIAVFSLYKSRRKILALFLLIIPAFLLVFTMAAYRRPNYVNTVDFAIIFAIVLALACYKRAGKWLALGFAAVLLLQSAWLFSEHSFTGFSETIQQIPDGSIVYATFYDGAIYYSGNYLADTAINNAFFSKFLQDIRPVGKERIEVVFGEENFSNEVDYAVLEEDFISHYDLDGNGFVHCKTEYFNEHQKKPVVRVYSISQEKCSVFD